MPWRVRDEPRVAACLGGNDLIGYFGRMFLANLHQAGLDPWFLRSAASCSLCCCK
jgi:hypothetical protein